MLKSVRAAALIAAAVCASNAHAQSRPIRFGTEGAFPPFNFVTPQGEVQGFEIDLAKAICDDLKAKCAFTAQDFDGLIPALEAKKFDVIIAAMNVTAKRKAHVDFTSVYVDVSGRFVGRKGSAAGKAAPSCCQTRGFPRHLLAWFQVRSTKVTSRTSGRV